LRHKADYYANPAVNADAPVQAFTQWWRFYGAPLNSALGVRQCVNRGAQN